MFTLKYENGNTVVSGISDFDLEKTLNCGQAFRWSECGDCFEGVAFGKYLKIKQDNDTLTFYGTSKEDFEKIWRGYFDLERDYAEIGKAFTQDAVLSAAMQYGKGIRILNQEPWETLCSFIISQNNNIPRIKGIITRFCENFGEDKGGYYSFPTAEVTAALTLDDLAVLRSGFRAKYILDAAKKVASGEIDLIRLSRDTDEARSELTKIYGVGAKVADCTLLFGLGHMDAFPKDVWIKKAMQKLFDGRLPECASAYAGLAQQYIFYYARETKLEV